MPSVFRKWETVRRRLPDLLVAVGLLVAAGGLLDPSKKAALFLGPAGALFGWLLGQKIGEPAGRRALAAVLAGSFAISGLAGPEMRGDTGSYFVYLRSLAFDHDLDFTNDWELLGHPEMAGSRSPRGYVSNWQTIGPALLWSPFYLAAHVYVRAGALAGLSSYPADGVSAPYLRAMALGTVTGAVIGAALLVSAIEALGGSAVALIATLAAILASPVVYYVFVVPGMAHGLAFGASAAWLWALSRARQDDSLGGWVRVGALLGCVVLLRPQGAVLGLMAAPVTVQGLLRGRVRPLHLAAAAAAALLVMSPQLIAWKVLYGSYVTMPQGAGYLDASAPHLLDVLFAANHGLFAWSPALALGLAGLLLLLRRDRWTAASALVVFLALTWTNGSVADWDRAGGDAFGARRFDVAVPLLALGLAALLAEARTFLGRRPLLAPAFLLLAFCVWNLGLVIFVRDGRYPSAAPLDRVASDEARLLRRGAEAALGALAGESARARAYDSLSGEYFYGALSQNDSLPLATADERTLRGGFSAPAYRQGGPPFRWALFPEACLTIPLPRDLRPRRVELQARAPHRALPQRATAVLNGRVLGEAGVPAEWTLLQFDAPPERWLSGENSLCLRFARATFGEYRVSAGIAEVRLPLSVEGLGRGNRPQAVDQDAREPGEQQ
jgi:hypothetical protein